MTGLVTDGLFGLSSDILNSSAAASVDVGDEDNTALSGNLQIFSDVINTDATIGAALINQKDSAPNPVGGGAIGFRNGSQSVGVDASTQYENLAEDGNFFLNLSPSSFISTLQKQGDQGGLKNAVTGIVKPTGDASGKNAIGISGFIDVLNNHTLATIDSGAEIGVGPAGNLSVTATQQIIAAALVQSGDDGGNVGIAGEVAWFNLTSLTQAQIEEGVTVNGGYSPGGQAEPGGPVDVDADDNTIMVGLTGGVVKSNGKGVGFAVSVNNASRTTLALIGNSPTYTTDPTTPSSYDVSGVHVNATEEGLVATVTYSAASISPSEGQVKTNNAPYNGSSFSFSDLGLSDPGAGQNGFGLSGAVSAGT